MTTVTTQITLIRHGETSWNANGRWQGHAPVPLNDVGREQARRLALHLAPIAADITAVYSSDLPRARETAQIIARTLELTVPLELDRRLREADLGEWQGMTNQDIEAWDYERWQEIVLDPSLPRPGGESPLQVITRATAALNEYVERHPGGHLLVVSHGGTIRHVLRGLDLIDIPVAKISNTSATTLFHDRDAHPHWRLQALTQAPHLGPDGGNGRQEG